MESKKMCFNPMKIIREDEENSVVECVVCGWTTELSKEIIQAEIKENGFITCWRKTDNEDEGYI